jgi:hypothetical protein
MRVELAKFPRPGGHGPGFPVGGGMDRAGGGMPADKHSRWEATMSVSILNTPAEVVRLYSRRLQVPILGAVAVPPPDKIAYYAGLGLLAALQVIEWPIALVITAGHVLADQHFSGLAKGLGKAFQQA